MLRLSAALIAGLILVASPGARPQGMQPTEHEVKAAFLYNFGKFVVWPKTAFQKDGVLTICVLSDDRILEALQRTVQDKQVQERRIDVRPLRSAKEAAACQILFIGAAEAARLVSVLKALNDESVLTVSDIDDFAEHGGMISLLLEQNKVRFKVNLLVAEQARLKVSSQLLKLARAVIRPPG